MMISRRHMALLLLALAIFTAVIYIFLLRHLVTEAYEGQSPEWFSEIVNLAYPRFEVEKQRFELEFFQNKADQIIIRLCLVLIPWAVILLLYHPNRLIERLSIRRSRRHFQILRFVFYLGLLAYTWDWYLDFEQVVRMQAFYKGVHIFRLLGLEVLELETYYFLFACYLLSLMMVLLNIRKIWFATSAALLFVFFQGYLFSFEKIEHSYTTLSYAAILMPFLFYELDRQQGTSRESFVLFLIQLSIAGAYFLAGLEKLLSSGFTWASAETFRTYIYLHQQELGLRIAESDFLAYFLPWGALLFQLLFLLVVFFPKYKFIFLLGGVGFHWGTRLLMGIGSFFSPWIFVYIFFLDWEKLAPNLSLSASRMRNRKKGM